MRIGHWFQGLNEALREEITGIFRDQVSGKIQLAEARKPHFLRRKRRWNSHSKEMILCEKSADISNCEISGG